MVLTLRGIVKTSDGTDRSFKDRRFMINRVIASYIGDDGHEYRKSFESKSYPIIPERGTHEELNKVQFQY